MTSAAFLLASAAAGPFLVDRLGKVTAEAV